MRTSSCLAAALTALSIGSFGELHAQRPTGASTPATASAQLPTPTTSLPTPSNTNVTITPVYLQRDAVKRAREALSVADKSKPKKSGILVSLGKTVEGDRHAIEAAKSVLATSARSLVKDGSATVIVVIGGEAELTKVVESLSRIERPIRVAYVDRAFEDATYDNTALNSGMIGSVKDAADNLWVYMPKSGSTRQKPDKVLSTKVATATMWNGLFASEGDAIDVDQLKSLVSKSDSATSRSSDAAVSLPSSTALAVGDVVAPKIGNVKVLAEASADAKVLGTVAKTDELVVAGAAKNGFVLVEGASVKGWVSVNLLAKH
jgi:hypothetical protein